MPEETKVTEVPNATPPEQTPPVVTPEPDEGDSPEAVGMRKSTLTRLTRVERELKEARDELIATRERARVLEEQREKSEKRAEQKIFTLKEVNAAVGRGEVTREQADEYIENIIFPAKAKALIETNKVEEAKLHPIMKARNEALEYVKYIPALNDRQSDEFLKVAREYQRLVADGHPADDRTELIAAKLVHGDLESIKRKAELKTLNSTAPMTPVNGRSVTPPAGGKVDISKAPASMVEKWDKFGFDQAARERSFKIHQELSEQRAARRG